MAPSLVKLTPPSITLVSLLSALPALFACGNAAPISDGVAGAGGSGGSAGMSGGGVGGSAGTAGDAGTGGRDGGGGTGGRPDASSDPYVYLAEDGDVHADGRHPTRAVSSLSEALSRAALCQPTPCEIRVAGGTYSEQVYLRGGMVISGGYDRAFTTQDPSANPVVLTSTADRSLIAQGLSEPTSLAHLTVRGADLSHRQDGTSSYALWLKGNTAALELVDVTVQGGRGAAGAAGGDATLTSCDVPGGAGGTTRDCGSAPGGAGSAGGDPVLGGEGGADGEDNCPNACPLTGASGVSAGARGADGGAGLPGLPGAISMDALGSFTDLGLWRGSIGGAGDRGYHGTSGGGGGGGGTKRFRSCFGCSTLLGGVGGAGGAAGCGGGGGSPGAVGGGAFAIALIDSKLKLARALISGGVAGPGGAGSDGASGSPGEPGAPGADRRSQRCGAINYHGGAGGDGGDGGAGGPGGGGAGGNGGAAITIAIVGTSELVEGEGVTITSGTAGPGGLGGRGGNDAQPGLAGEVWTQLVFPVEITVHEP